MKTAAVLALCAAALAAAPAAAQPKKPPAGEGGARVERTEEVNLAVGENKTIPAGGVQSFSEGTRGIADVKLTPDNTQFVVVGQKPGSTTLLLIKNDGTQITYVINVFSRSPHAVERELGQLLEGTTGVRVRRVGSRFFIEGGVTTEGDLRRIQQIASLYPGQVESLVVIGSGAAERKFNVRVDFFFVQYERSMSYAFGVGWPARIGGDTVVQNQFTYDFLAGTVTTANASVVNQPLPALDIGQRKGWLKVLKQSTIITTNGSEAFFESGGEQNFQITAGLSAAIQRIAFGTNVKVLPRFDSNSKDLEVKVDADVSDLTPPVAGQTPLPGRSTSKLSTLVHMKLGQSLVLSGIRSRSQRHDIAGLPILSTIPVLGIFFGSHRDARDDIEGAVFVIPSVVEAPTRPAVDMIQGALQAYEEFSGDVDAVNAFPKRPPPSPAEPPK